MCGIFFSIGFSNLPGDVIDSVSHRGPNGRGWDEFTSPYGPIVMAHRRLAIIDLSADGHQPMELENKRFWITYNGEIYNYLEIKQELIKLGYRFKTKTDTEVLLRSYIHWQEQCLNRFNGMFSFVVWDNERKTVFAARDRFGEKPLYYYKQENKIAFASEIKQFKKIPGWQSILNASIAQEYQVTGYSDNQDTTLYNHVFQILPGHYLKIDNTVEDSNPVCWYNLKQHIHPTNLPDVEITQKFQALFEDAISIRLRSDIPVGACLSGGLDSSSIVSVMQKIHPHSKKIPTFSSVFPSHRVDESVYIDQFLKQKKIISYKNYPSFDLFLEKIDSILYHQDLPFSGSSVFAQWHTFQNAKEKGITVLLDGQGADESLLGYPGMLNGLIFDYIKHLKFQEAFIFLWWQSKYNNQTIRKTLMLALKDRYPELYRILLNIKNRKTPIMSSIGLNTITNVCLKYFSNDLQTLLRYEDRNSMAFSRESRLPFLDYRLVEFILSLPTHQRFRHTQTKWVLRKAMKNINIETILNRKDKTGFATPEKEWWEKLLTQKHTTAKNLKDFIFQRWISNEF